MPSPRSICTSASRNLAHATCSSGCARGSVGRAELLPGHPRESGPHRSSRTWPSARPVSLAAVGLPADPGRPRGRALSPLCTSYSAKTSRTVRGGLCLGAVRGVAVVNRHDALRPDDVAGTTSPLIIPTAFKASRRAAPPPATSRASYSRAGSGSAAAPWIAFGPEPRTFAVVRGTPMTFAYAHAIVPDSPLDHGQIVVRAQGRSRRASQSGARAATWLIRGGADLDLFQS